MEITIDKGLDIPIAGRPRQQIEPGPAISKVALLGQDTIGLKPRMQVSEGDRVKLGQTLFFDRHNPALQFTSPASGTVLAIVRGPKRVLQAVIITVEGEEEVSFPVFEEHELDSLERQQVVEQLASSGLWSSLRTRPYSKIPHTTSQPAAIFVSAMDSNPLAADPPLILAEYGEDFQRGLTLLTRLTDGLVHVCHARGSELPLVEHAQIRYHQFAGPHPAGLVGTHIHFVEPAINRTLWHINYQDVIAMGKLFTTGRLWTERIISLAGPMVKQPRLITTRLGASTEDMVRDNIASGPCRVVSGPLLSGHQAVRWATFLGRYHLQLCALPEGGERQLFGWLNPFVNKHSALKVLWSNITGKRDLPLNTLQNGSPRAIIPLGLYEAVMPLDILATPLLKAIIVGDTDMAQKLGCLELDEEDLAPCSYVCPGKTDFGKALRACLSDIERNG